MTSCKIVACTLLSLTPIFTGCTTMGDAFYPPEPLTAPVPPVRNPLDVIADRATGLPMPVCIANDGTQVQYIVDSVSEFDSPFAYKSTGSPDDIAANAEEGLPGAAGAYIVYNLAFMKSLSRESQAFVAAHECVHHKLGHTDVQQPSLEQVQESEKQADCEAVRIMHNSYGMNTNSIRAGIRRFFTSAIFEGSEEDIEHGSGTERYKLTLQCIPG
jgi:hypothetical protein